MTAGCLGVKPRDLGRARNDLVPSSFGLAVWVSVALAVAVIAPKSAQADSELSPYQLQRLRVLFVDADHPSTWPKEVEPISAGELRKVFGTEKDPDSDPRAVQIEQADYHATFRDGALCDGSAEFTLGNGRRPALVSLDHAGPDSSHLLEFSHLRWAGEPRDQNTVTAKNAILCGIDRAGRRVVIAEPGRSRLECDWSLAGRSSLGATEFALSLPPAVVSQIVLRVPVGLSVESDQGVLVRTAKDPDGRSTMWRLALGSRSSCRVRIVASAAPGNLRVFYDEDTTLIVASDRLRFQSKLQLDVFGAPLRTLRLAVPAGLRVETISYGDDCPLPVPASSVDKAREIALDLPEPLFGKGRTISVEASAATRTNGLWNLPQVGVPGALRREGQVQLTIQTPLKLVRFGGELGLAQSEAPTYSIDGEETFFLRQNAFDAPLGIEIAEPAPALAARTLARLDLRRDRCAFAADVVCSASRGSTFSVAFELPDAWDVTRVEAVGDVSRMIDETTRAVAEHRKRVRIDFFRAVTDREPKRFRVEASRSLPRSGEAIDVPVIEFPAFASQEVETLVVHGASIELGLTPAAAFVAFDPTAILSVLADSPLRPDRSVAADTHMLTHRWTAQTVKAQIRLRRGEEGVAARVKSTVEVSAAQILDRIDATIVPASPLDHLLVYVSSEGAPLSWHVSTDRGRTLEGTRLPAARHSEWNLPDGGELWEIHLPEPCRNEFHLQGTRRTSSSEGARIGLAFIPGARSFDGIVELHLQDARQFDVEAHELRATNATTNGNRSVRSFHYDSPADALVVRPRSTGASPAEARLVSLRLTSYLNAGGADDFHRAEFSVAPELTAQPFHFRLDAESRLCSVAVNGQPVRVRRQADEITVPALPPDAWNRVQIEYKTTPAGGLLRENRPIIVPRAKAEILAFRWRVYLAPSLQPGPPSGLRFDEPLPALSWAERLFGPLGRSIAQMRLSSFKADAWMVDLAGADPEAEAGTPEDPERPPAGWSSWDASAEQVPADIGLTIWHAGEFRALAWIVCLGCLSAGLGVARFATRATHRLGLLAVAAALAFAVAAPSPYAFLAGAGVSGALVAVLLSRPWKRSAAPLAPSQKLAPRPGSTVSFEMRAVTMLLALAMLGAISAFAQETPPAEPRPRDVQAARASSDSRRAPRTPDGDLLVVIPVHPSRMPSMPAAALPDDKELVYVSPRAIDLLRRGAAERSRNEGVVFLSSSYAISLEERQPATIEATYRVAVMPGAGKSLWLRLSNVTLAGADACRVDGRASPIRNDGTGFVLLLDPNVPPGNAVPAVPADSSAPGPRRPISAERPSLEPITPISHDSPTHSERTNATSAEPDIGGGQARVHEIHLTYFPNGEAKPGQFEIRVPETAHTMVRVATAGPWQALTLEAHDGKTRRLRAGEPSIDVGQTDRIRIKAGPAPAKTINTTIAAQAAQFLRVSPGLVEMDCRVTYQRENGTGDKFTWLVPAGAAVRTAGDTYRTALRARTPRGNSDGGKRSAGEGLVPLDFDCSAVPNGPVTLAATLLLPIDLSRADSDAPPVDVRLPRFDASGADQAGILLTSNQVGISAAPGYRVIAATTEVNLSHTGKADPTFRQESFGTRKEPDLIFDCQGVSTLPLQLVAVVPAHKVRVMSHESRVSADRIQWRTTAEIRTENAPAFVHVLRVDRRLKIDSISVREDDVERLVRFSQTGDEVTLFLRDRAAATQDLVLTGHLPLEPGRPTRLPTVSLLHGVVSESHLAISHDPDVEVAVGDAPGVVRMSSTGAGTSVQRTGDAATSPAVLDYSLTGGAMPEIRVTRRPESAPIARASAPAAINVAKVPAPATHIGLQSSALESPEQKPRVEVATTLELRRDGSAAGSTHVLLERLTQPTLRLSWPASFILRGALLDGRLIQPNVGDGQIALPVPSDPLPHRIALHWERRSASALKALGRIREELPVPLDGSVNSILLSVAAPPGIRLFTPAHFAPLDPQIFARQLDAIQSADRSVAAEGTPGSFRTLSADTTVENRLIGRLAVGPSDAVVSAWALDTLWLRLPLAAAIFVLIAAAAVHPYAARAGGWLLNHPPFTLAAVGLIWWLCLWPRAAGPLWLVIALGMLIIELRRRQRSARSLPSTLRVAARD